MSVSGSMRPETPERHGPLRTGLTTGACATAASVAAARLLLTGRRTEVVTISLPRGQQPEMTIADLTAKGNAVIAGVIKDAGDDPDATHGARLWVEVTLLNTPRVVFRAGAGVGTVTRKGLTLAVGEPAINPVPRRMIAGHLQSLDYSVFFVDAPRPVTGEAVFERLGFTDTFKTILA